MPIPIRASLPRATITIALLCAVSTCPARAASTGSVAWSREQPGAASLFMPAVGPTGTVYTSNGGAITAIAADGTVLWSVSMDGAPGPVAVGSDGTIYANAGAVGANPTIRALNPDGTERWTFDAGASIHAGPNIGPDGNIYAVADTWFGGMGFFALDPDGQLLWSEQGDPALSADTGQPHEIVFNDAVAFLAMTPQGGSNGDPPGLWAFDLGAEEQAFVLLGSCQGQPVVNPLTGELVTGNGFCQTIEYRDAATGALIWDAPSPSQSPCSGLANIAAGPDGSIYTAFCYRAFWSLTIDGTERWFDDDFSFYFQMNRLGVAPDNTVVLDLGGDVGMPGWVRAFSPESGLPVWQLDLDLASQKASSRPVFDLDAGRAYFNVNRFGADTSDVFAIDLDASPPCPADLDGSGTVAVADMLLLLASWDTAGADVTGDGLTNVADLLALLEAWGPCP